MTNVKYNIVVWVTIMLSGCSATYELQRSSLAVDDEIPVIFANVNNPYPKCDPNKTIRRVANLSVERSERVYLQDGVLCQRP